MCRSRTYLHNVPMKERSAPWEVRVHMLLSKILLFKKLWLAKTQQRTQGLLWSLQQPHKRQTSHLRAIMLLPLRAKFWSKLPLFPQIGSIMQLSKGIHECSIMDCKRLDRASYRSSHILICALTITPLWYEIRNGVKSVPSSSRHAAPG